MEYSMTRTLRCVAPGDLRLWNNICIITSYIKWIKILTELWRSNRQNLGKKKRNRKVKTKGIPTDAYTYYLVQTTSQKWITVCLFFHSSAIENVLLKYMYLKRTDKYYLTIHSNYFHASLKFNLYCVVTMQYLLHITIVVCTVQTLKNCSIEFMP